MGLISGSTELKESVRALKNYVEQREERLKGMHQALADHTATHLSDIYTTLNEQQDRGCCTRNSPARFRMQTGSRMSGSLPNFYLTDSIG